MNKHGIQSMFVFLILGLFALTSTLLVLLGAQAYRGTAQRSETHNHSRIVRAFVRSAVRAEDGRGNIYSEIIDGVPVLTIETEIGGETYQNRLYCAEGYLKSRYTTADVEFSAEAGETLCPAQGFEPTVDGNCLTAKIIDENGEESDICVALWAND